MKNNIGMAIRIVSVVALKLSSIVGFLLMTIIKKYTTLVVNNRMRKISIAKTNLLLAPCFLQIRRVRIKSIMR